MSTTKRAKNKKRNIQFINEEFNRYVIEAIKNLPGTEKDQARLNALNATYSATYSMTMNEKNKAQPEKNILTITTHARYFKDDIPYVDPEIVSLFHSIEDNYFQQYKSAHDDLPVDDKIVQFFKDEMEKHHITPTKDTHTLTIKWSEALRQRDELALSLITWFGPRGEIYKGLEDSQQQWHPVKNVQQDLHFVPTNDKLVMTYKNPSNDIFTFSINKNILYGRGKVQFMFDYKAGATNGNGLEQISKTLAGIYMNVPSVGKISRKSIQRT